VTKGSLAERKRNMKTLNPNVEANRLRSAFYLLLIVALCATPLALAQRGATSEARRSSGPVGKRLVGGGNTLPASIIIVTTTNDSGPGSLRQALVDAHYGDTINFDSSLKGQTITLTSGRLIVDKNVTISGPGANHLAVDGNATDWVFSIDLGPTVTISGLTITNGNGGILHHTAGTLTLSNSTISDNSSTSGGGGILALGTLTMSNCTISGNSAQFGGGIALFNSTFTLSNCTISGNSAEFDGGGIYSVNCALTVNNCTINGNSGGGISHTGSGNGIATLMVTNSTISGNSATGNGGGITSRAGNSVFTSSASVTVSNSTISDNSVAGDGGAISNRAFLPHSAALMITNSTISGNSATGNGGGIYNEGTGASELGSTILNAGSSGENIFNNAGTVTSHGYNLSSDDGGGILTGPGDQINTDPLLGPLQDNGGSTFTHTLLPGSPAINAGDPSFTPPPFYDQRRANYIRVYNGRIDIGSFELQPRPAPTPRPRPTPAPRP
jgi:predicted outer membrane repeat protein